ncbi:MAG: hypothetical protein IJ757_03050 [Clostridiales bacterium]|nr:hypothetical protein [Clostridiales bacterium]
MMVVSALLMSDSVIAGIVIGADAVAGITLVTPVYSLAAFFGSIISLGVPIVYSSEMGRFNKKEADHVFGLGILMAFVVGIVLLAGVTAFGDMYLRSSLPPDSVLYEARGYLSWMRFSMLLLPLQMLIASAVYSDGDEAISTAANVVQGVGNIIASVILGHSIGIIGIGIASFAFNVIALLILLMHFLRKSNSLRFNLYFSWGLLKCMVRYSFVDASSYLFLAILTAVLNVFVSYRFGGRFLILVSVIALIREFQLVFDGIGEAVTPIFCIYRGEENPDGIRSTYRLARNTAVVEGIIVTIVLCLCAPLIPGILSITDPELIEVSVMAVRIVSLGSVFVSLLYLLTSYYLVIDKIALGVVACALRDVLLSVVLALPLGSAFGISSMFIGLALAPAISYFLLLLYIHIRYGAKNCPLFLTDLMPDRDVFIYNLVVETKEIIDLQKKIGDLLVEKGYDSRTVGRVKLIIEEVYMLIREKNKSKMVRSECTVDLSKEGVKIITKDDGEIFDVSSDDVTVTSLAAYAVSSYMDNLGDDKRYLTTMSFNRSSFLIKAEGNQAC